MNKTKLFPILLMMVALAFSITACSDDDDDDHSSSADDDAVDDDAVDDDVADDDVIDDDTSDDDTGDDDTSDDDTDDDVCDEETHDPLIVQGKGNLSDLEPEAAYENFAAALEACPSSADAKAGMVIADAQWLVLWFQAAVEGKKGIGEDLQQMFTEELLPVSGEMMTLADDLIANNPKMRFFVDPLPLWVEQGHVALEMGGEWDIYDIANAKAFARLWEGVGRVLLALNLVYDEQLFEDNPVPPGSTTTEMIHHYCGLLLEMFDDPDYDSFLTFLEGGAESLSNGGVNLGLGMVEVKANFFAMRNEVDLQEDDIAGYVDLNDNGQWDEGEPFRAPFFGAFTVEFNESFIDLLDLIKALGASLLDGGPEDLDPDKQNWFLLSELNPILEYFDVLWPDDPIRLPAIPIPFGIFFYNIGDDGLRPLAVLLTNILFAATEPEPPVM